MKKHKKITLMPIIALAALSLMVALPTLSSTRLFAAGTTHFSSITVQPGDTLWSIAAAHTTSDGDVQDTLDSITDANHLHGSALQVGQHLRIPN